MVTDMANIANANILKVAFPFAYLYSIFTHYKGQGQGQGHAHFHCEFIANGYRLSTHCYCQQIESRMWTFDQRI